MALQSDIFEAPIPVCPVRGSVLYPTMVMPIDAGRAVSIRAINAALDRNRTILIVSQRDRETEEPTGSDLFTVGTACNILRMKRNPNGSIQMLVQAFARVRVKRYTTGELIEAEVEPFEVPLGNAVTLEAAFRELKEKFSDIIEGGVRNIQPEVAQFVMNLEDAGQFADYVAYHLDFRLEDKQAILEAETVEARVRRVLVLIDTEIELAETQRRVQREVKDEIDRNQREYFLREQIKALQRELSGSDDGDDEVETFRAKLEELELPEEAMKEAERELNRLARMHPDSAEASVIRTYLTTLTELPWNERSQDRLDIEVAKQTLEEDHYGLEKIKDRILEYLAVRKLKADRAARGELDQAEVNRGPILLFAGPPGVGKTSIAKSIAKALGREYVRISLGGARDESDIRGHRRTYIGSMPGRIIQGIRQAGTKNPVFLLDEIDKLGMSYQGDPSSALLEVLDPAQNSGFVDHYLGVPFDLSEVLFIATANYAQNIPEALLDRMELLEFSSYIEQEKIEIAKRYLLPRQIEENGLKPQQITISDGAIAKVITSYTREAGVRNLERTIGTLARKAARRIAEGESKRVRITERSLEAFLGPERFSPESEGEENLVGVATGMYYTPVGGDILFVETSVTKGKGGLVLTGQLGDVMKESARAALTYARSNAERFGIPQEVLDNYEVHIHVPAGATPKEGPSAGVAIAASLISALTGVPVRKDVAATGEITLRGRVLPIGGLKEKILGAKRAGIRHILFPEKNLPDLGDIPAHLRRSLEFHPVAHLDRALDIFMVGGLAALEARGGGKSAPKKARRRRKEESPAAQA
ncbi:ATP-dependent protease La [Truepera radiovictrix DSM 17093]|uniref:Lon protease n=2 Tax=Truepera TaxID=332248 RepID=D7CS64_TRURR|nr:endopeptidase La [Truepera radiovictrix]ADI13596.1 ATP-dependent protease La [Truepera radiovictrix DSM 17093]WMT57841.1 endopeptidase La [Truepera radiovictrix]